MQNISPRAPYSVPPDSPRRRNRLCDLSSRTQTPSHRGRAEKFLLELRIPRAANVARITHRLVVNRSQKASSELAAQS